MKRWVWIVCVCGHREKWPIPIDFLGEPQCTCPECGQPMHERGDATPADVAHDLA